MVAFYNQADQDIYNSGSKFVPQERYRLGYTPPVQGGGQDASTPSFGIPATNAFTNSGGNGYSGSTGDLINNFNAINQDKYFSNQKTPNVNGLDQSMRDKTFMGMRSYNENQDVNPVDAGEYLAAGQDIPTRFDPTFAGKVQNTLGKGKDLIGKGAGMAMNAALGIPGLSYALGKMDRFNTLPAMDRDFINQSKYYTGPTVFGKNTGNQDPFGINTRSALGNYGAYTDKAATDLTAMLSGKQAEKYGKGTSGISFNVATGMFEALDKTDQAAIDAALNATKMNKMNITKQRFYTKGVKKRASDLKIAQSDAAAINDKATNQKFQDAMAQGEDFYAGLNNGRGATSTQESRRDSGGGEAANKGEAGSGWENSPFAKGGRAGYFFGGRVNFKNGGLASIL